LHVALPFALGFAQRDTEETDHRPVRPNEARDILSVLAFFTVTNCTGSGQSIDMKRHIPTILGALLHEPNLYR
jgi:hypothetical protein